MIRPLRETEAPADVYHLDWHDLALKTCLPNRFVVCSHGKLRIAPGGSCLALSDTKTDATPPILTAANGPARPMTNGFIGAVDRPRSLDPLVTRKNFAVAAIFSDVSSRWRGKSCRNALIGPVGSVGRRQTLAIWAACRRPSS